MIKLKNILTENLNAWFGKGKSGGVGGGGWDRYNSSGDRVGKCGDAKSGDAYSACLSKEKAAKLGKDGRAAFVKRKRAAQKKGGDAKKGGEQSKGQKPIKVKTGANEEMTPREADPKQKIVDIAKEFMDSESYNSNHDCKRSTYEFINWLKKNKKFEPDALLLAPPEDIKKFPGKSGEGDSHIFTIINGYGVDFTANQFPGISEPLKITPEDQIPSEYKKIGGYYTNFPDWFENYKTSIKTKFNNLPQWFRDGFEKEGFKPELKERLNLFLEKNIPTDPAKWSYWKSQAKKKFDVYPSAYANGWAAKKYKAAGGGWKKG